VVNLTRLHIWGIIMSNFVCRVEKWCHTFYVDQVSKWTQFDDVEVDEGMMSRDLMHQVCYRIRGLFLYDFLRLCLNVMIHAWGMFWRFGHMIWGTSWMYGICLVHGLRNIYWGILLVHILDIFTYISGTCLRYTSWWGYGKCLRYIHWMLHYMLDACLGDVGTCWETYWWYHGTLIIRISQLSWYLVCYMSWRCYHMLEAHHWWHLIVYVVWHD